MLNIYLYSSADYGLYEAMYKFIESIKNLEMVSMMGMHYKVWELNCSFHRVFTYPSVVLKLPRILCNLQHREEAEKVSPLTENCSI